MKATLQSLSDPIRWAMIILLGFLLVWVGFSREKKLLIIEKGVPVFIDRYPKKNVVIFEKTRMKGTFGIKVPAKLQSSVLFSLLYLILGSSVLMLYARSIFIGKLWAVINIVNMLVCFILLKLADFGVDYRLSGGLSHYLEDLFLSPFLVLAMAVLIKATGLIQNQTPNKL